MATKGDLEPLATKADLHILKADLQLMRAELETKIVGAAHRQTVQFGLMMSAGLAIAVAAIGVIVSAH